MKPTLIDTHCHPPAEAEDPSASWLHRAIEAGVSECIAVGTDREDWPLHRELSLKFPDNLYWTVGLHPSYVEADFAEQVQAIPAYLKAPPEERPCAIGEIGLDFTRLPKNERDECKERQRQAFRLQLQIASDYGLPVVIHSRGTVTECLGILDESGFPAEKTIFHCFAEGPETLSEIRTCGANCSFTGIVTFKNAANVREAMKANGLENLILETDSPYLSPEPFRGKKNEPARVATLAEYCASVFETTPEEIARITTANARSFFDLSQ